MNAIVAAREVYVRCGSLRSFEEDLRAHLLHGFVISTPAAFAMGRPVRRDAPEEELADIGHRFAEPDAWLVWSAAGDLETLARMLPGRLPWIMFHRQSERRRGPGRLRIYRAERLVRLANLRRPRERGH